MLEADAFMAFKEKGIFNKEVAKSYRKHILEAGAQEHPAILYARFRGKEPTPEAMFKRLGLI
jgi:peptidyl-dipeptidase Dcp